MSTKFQELKMHSFDADIGFPVYLPHRPQPSTRCNRLDCTCNQKIVKKPMIMNLQRPPVNMMHRPQARLLQCHCFECRINKRVLLTKRHSYHNDIEFRYHRNYQMNNLTSSRTHSSIGYNKDAGCSAMCSVGEPRRKFREDASAKMVTERIQHYHHEKMLNRNHMEQKNLVERKLSECNITQRKRLEGNLRDKKLSERNLAERKLLEMNFTECYLKSVRDIGRRRTKMLVAPTPVTEFSYFKVDSLKKSAIETDQEESLNSPLMSFKRASFESHPELLYKVNYGKNNAHPINTRQQKRRFQCLHCEKSFGKSSHLRDHHRTHSGERPFGCRYCGKAFSQFSNLRTHLRIHTGEKPFKCHVCKKSFTQRVTLRSHLRTHNPKNK